MRTPVSYAASSGGMTWILHALGGTCKAAPVRDARSTLVEQSACTVGLACTMFTSKVAESEGMMAIAKVCQVCGCEHGKERAEMTPLKSFTPAQHSGVVTQAALAPGTDAAGQCLVVVATPNTPIGPGREALGVLAAGVPVPDVLVPDVLGPGVLAPAGLLAAGPLPAGLWPGESRRGTTSSAAITATAMPAPAAASARE